MTSMHFDTLDYAERLVAAGESREVASVHAQTMKSALVTLSDDLVTRDYLDQRLAHFRVDMEQRFSEQDARIEQRFAEQDVRLEQRFSAIDTRLGRLETKLNMTNAIVLAAVAVPQVANVALKFV